MSPVPAPHGSLEGVARPDRVRLDGLAVAAAEVIGRAVPVDARGLPVHRVRVPSRPAEHLPRLHPSGAVVDEWHRLVVHPDAIELQAASDEGELRAATALALMLTDPVLPRGAFEDEPRLGWRGLSLDVARTPLRLCDLREIVEILVSMHGNVLHLHLTDDQGWRLPVHGRPELTAVGGAMAMAGRPGFAYDLDEYAALVQWARDRHVWVVPEIDMPGHVGALLAAHPEVAAGQGVPGEYASRLRLDHQSEDTYRLLADVLGAAADLHPSPWLHIGGDEAFGMADADYREFFARLVDELGLDPSRLIGWQEAVRADVGIGTLQVWRDLDRVGLESDPEVRRRLGLLAAADVHELTTRGRADVARISRERRDVILSPSLVAYLDRPYAEPDVDGHRPEAGLPVYRPRRTRESFEFTLDDVVPGLDPRCVAGVEAALWTETIPDAATAQRMMLPRLAGILQRAWEREPSSWSQHAERVRRLQPLWDARGWRHHRSVDLASKATTCR